MVFLIKLLVKVIKVMIIALKIETGPLAGLVHKLEEMIKDEITGEETTAPETTTL